VSVGSLIERAGPEILVYVPTPSDKHSSVPAGGSDPAPRPTRRVFTPVYKLAMVVEYENAPMGRKARSFAVRASIPPISLNGRGLCHRLVRQVSAARRGEPAGVPSTVAAVERNSRRARGRRSRSGRRRRRIRPPSVPSAA
jgi:hypothetical protein